LEAKPRLGRRILGGKDNQNTEHYFDLGPAWIFPHQNKIQRLFKQLGSSIFGQYTSGDVLYQTSADQPPRCMQGAGDLQLFKIQGGSQSLISALQSSLDQNNLHLNHVIKNI
jgi:monoamine oxidase